MKHRWLAGLGNWGLLIVGLGSALALSAQDGSALMNTKDTLAQAERGVQLAESLALAFPDLHRAGGPLIETAKQAHTNLKGRANQTAYTYSLLSSLRGFVAMADAVPKQFPAPGEALKQLAELQSITARIDVHFRALLDNAEFRLRNPDRDNLRRYADANARLAPVSPVKPRVVFFGDSITDGWRLNEYFSDRDFVNRGISGQVTGEMLGRMKADVIDLKPQAMLILAGTNDLARGTSLATIQNNCTMIAELAAAHKIKVIFASVLPIHDYNKAQNPSFERSKDRQPASILALNNWLRTYSMANGHTYLDYFASLVDNAGMLKADYAEDGLHPNAAGYRVMAPLAQAAIDRNVSPQPDGKKKRQKVKTPKEPKPAPATN